MSVAIAEARQTVQAPARTARRFGLFSVAQVVDDTDVHWMQGGLTAEGEECSKPTIGVITCDPMQDGPKLMRSWYTDIDGDPWMNYMLETCKTPVRYGTASAALRTRFLAAEQSGAEHGFQQFILDNADALINDLGTVSQAVGILEQQAAAEYGGQIILHFSTIGGAEAIRQGIVIRAGDRLETVSGNPVVIGNYATSQTIPEVWATGGISLHRSPLIETGPVVDRATNDYFALIERAYAALVDCFLQKTSFTSCLCGSGAGPS